MKYCIKCKSNVVVKDLDYTVGVHKSIHRYVCPVCGHNLTGSKVWRIIGLVFAIVLLLFYFYGVIDGFIN